MSRLYTKTGDAGMTNLYDMRKLGKDDLYFEVLGDLDELSAHIGLACTFLENFSTSVKVLRSIQSKLLDVGSDIATVKNRDRVVPITEADVVQLETYIDEFCSNVPSLTEFILPGYKKADAQLHICRSVCRRVERHMWALKNTINLETGIETYKFMNRLSDFFFALARTYTRGNDIKRSEVKNILE
jgi:cob(I)alamin adenosyltransferase